VRIPMVFSVASSRKYVAYRFLDEVSVIFALRRDTRGLCARDARPKRLDLLSLSRSILGCDSECIFFRFIDVARSESIQTAELLTARVFFMGLRTGLRASVSIARVRVVLLFGNRIETYLSLRSYSRVMIGHRFQ
jgi:hypothetical protein